MKAANLAAAGSAAQEAVAAALLVDGVSYIEPVRPF
jgi:hypothetical protein